MIKASLVFFCLVCLVFQSCQFSYDTDQEMPVEEIRAEPSISTKPSALKEELEKPSLPQELNSIPEEIKRTVLILWDSQFQIDIGYTLPHKSAEMPLNFLGLKAQYVDLQEPLPSLNENKDILGIISWLPQDYKVKRPNLLLRWLIDAIENHIKVIAIGSDAFQNEEENYGLINELWEHLGLYPLGTWTSLTYNFKISQIDSSLYNFEGEIPVPLPSFQNFLLADSEAKPYLSVESKLGNREEFIIAIINQAGAYIPEDFLIYNISYGDLTYKRWYINPFKFFKTSLGIPNFPVPDPSTVAGRRAYFSHIDGDGWNNVTSVIDSRGKEGILSSEVILNSIAKTSSDLPLTIGPIAANLDLAWNGSKKAQQIARQFFQLSHIEVGCHTFSHPFDWLFFKNYTPEKEVPLLSRYQTKTWKDTKFDSLKRLIQKNESFYKTEDSSKFTNKNQPEAEKDAPHYYTPRAYALEPFNLEKEVTGAIDEINQFTPKNKAVRVYQWSGNGLPWKEVIELVEKDRVQNINGGDPRFDFMHPSYAYVSPLTRNVQNALQIYSASSNENLYTDLWTKDFYGLANLPITLDWTESPLRVKAMNLYYHMYSGEKLPSLYALFINLAYIRIQNIAPVATSEYCSFVHGFQDVNILPLNERKWKIRNRKNLQTFRFDQSTLVGVDFDQSEGIVGQRHTQGSLYVYLDKTAVDPIISLIDLEDTFPEPSSKDPYLIESRWQVCNLNRSTPTWFSFETQGFGNGENRWKVPKNGMYQITLFTKKGKTLEQHSVKAENFELNWIFTKSALRKKHVEVIFKGLHEP